LAIEDVCFGACASATDWKTVLIGSLREGGPALYSLDVTDPSRPVYLWTFYDGNLGNTFSAPVIAKVTVNLTGSPVDKWVAILGGGLSSTPSDANYAYVIDALTGAILQDTSGTQSRFQVDMDGLPKNNLAARATIYRPQDGPYVSTAYFGDTQGRLNRMDLSGPSIPNWRPARFFDPSDAACKSDIFGNPNTPILKASDGSSAGTLPLANISDPPAIYTRAVIAKDRTGRKMVFVGTGDSTNPTSNNDTNYFYAVRDMDTGAVCSGTPAWVKRFDPGEKVVADPVVAGSSVILSTYLPPAAGAICNDSGSAMLYSFDMVSGAPSSTLTDSRGNHVSKVAITGGGIVSDLAISGRSLVFNTSNHPTQVQTVSLNVGTSVSVRSWRRIR
jgi:Tfp pilus tip-associated adhesin PilY1